MLEKILTVGGGEVTIGLPEYFEGKKVLVSVELAPKMRSVRANKRYFAAIVRALSDHTGYTKEETHDMLKVTLNPKEVPDLRTGETKVVGGSTASMKSHEFADYTMKVQELCEFLGVKIPTVEEYWNSLEYNGQ